MKYVVVVEGETFEIEVGRGGRVWVNRCLYNVDFQPVDGLPQYSLLVDHRSYEAHVEQTGKEDCQMVVAGQPYRTSLQQERRRSQQGARQSRLPETVARQDSSQGEIRAPLPGLLVAVTVVVGQRVTRGKVVAVLESMKMNLELCAPWDGVVQALYITPGTEVGQAEVLAVIAPDERGESLAP
ncbi:MAG: biotin/lipoyl-containing protein [Chloroflexota bacterium]|nr:biotin/lipoyl-containing protein [Chloroflexota bacterium]